MHTANERARQILSDADLERELVQFLDAGGGGPRAIISDHPVGDHRAGDHRAGDHRAGAFGALPSGLEAIVHRFGRPSLLTWNGQFDPPRSEVWRGRLEPHRDAIEHAARSVGRVEVRGFAGSHLGTAWMISDDIAVTNRHVASIFAARGNGVYPLQRGAGGRALDVFVDFLAERDNPNHHDVRVLEVLYIAEDGAHEPDIAFLRLDPHGHSLPPPLRLATQPPPIGLLVVNIGYPAFDSRNDAADQQRIFDGVFNVKRVAPGEVTGHPAHDQIAHDCTTLGGCSGAVLLDPTTAEAVGLHFAGRESEANWAVAAPTVHAAFERYVLGTGSFVPRFEAPAAWTDDQERAAWADDLASRTGYDPAFLGIDQRTVPLPAPIDPSASLTVANPGTGARHDELRYTHFSVVMHGARRLALLTAVNIDGSAMVRRKRGADPWRLDPRIEAGQQLDNAVYRGNPLDRGHLVRRLDPTWGAKAAQAERDTFFWTNCAPQHAHLNQRMWLGLEDHILGSAHTHGFRASVFSGPIFANDDPPYRGTQLPQAFWKVVVMLTDAEGGPRLWATGYLLSQAHWLSDLEFAFGAFATYQVPIRRLQRLAAIDFAHLVAYDPLAALETTAVRRLDQPGDILF